MIQRMFIQDHIRTSYFLSDTADDPFSKEVIVLTPEKLREMWIAARDGNDYEWKHSFDQWLKEQLEGK